MSRADGDSWAELIRRDRRGIGAFQKLRDIVEAGGDTEDWGTTYAGSVQRYWTECSNDGLLIWVFERAYANGTVDDDELAFVTSFWRKAMARCGCNPEPCARCAAEVRRAWPTAPLATELTGKEMAA